MDIVFYPFFFFTLEGCDFDEKDSQILNLRYAPRVKVDSMNLVFPTLHPIPLGWDGLLPRLALPIGVSYFSSVGSVSIFRQL